MCAASVQDLMATIAKLDSNGVQVLPEREPEPGPGAAGRGLGAEPAPGLVHSSTDDTRGKHRSSRGVLGCLTVCKNVQLFWESNRTRRECWIGYPVPAGAALLV